MSGFFQVTDAPERRVVQYKRVNAPGVGVVFLDDETVLGAPVDDMPYADKTGIGVSGGGVLFEVPYLPDAGRVYFAVQPEDCAVGETPCLTASDAHGFTVEEAEVIYWGRCPGCAATTPTEQAKEERARV